MHGKKCKKRHYHFRGFKEEGAAGAELEKKVAEIALQTALLCLDQIASNRRCSADLNASFSASKPYKGHIAFLSQSGALALPYWTRHCPKVLAFLNS